MITSSCVQLVQAQREYTAGTERLEEANKMLQPQVQETILV